MEPTLRLSRSLSSLNPWFSVLTCSKSPSVFRSFAFRLSLSLVTAWSSYKITIETTFVMDMLTRKKMPRLVLTFSWLKKKTKKETEAFVMWPQWAKYPVRVDSCIHSKNQLVWHNFSYTYKVWKWKKKTEKKPIITRLWILLKISTVQQITNNFLEFCRGLATTKLSCLHTLSIRGCIYD